MSEITVYVIDLEQARELKMSDEAETAVVKLSEHDDIIRLKNLEHDELTRQNKILRDALEYVLEDHDCEHIDCIEFNKQRAREALKSCDGGVE